MAKTPEKATVAEKSLYRLTRRYWDGRVEHAVDDKLYFVPGTQPKSAKLISEQELPEVPALDPAPAEEDDE